MDESLEREAQFSAIEQKLITLAEKEGYISYDIVHYFVRRAGVLLVIAELGLELEYVQETYFYLRSLAMKHGIDIPPLNSEGYRG